MSEASRGVTRFSRRLLRWNWDQDNLYAVGSISWRLGAGDASQKQIRLSMDGFRSSLVISHGTSSSLTTIIIWYLVHIISILRYKLKLLCRHLVSA